MNLWTSYGWDFRIHSCTELKAEWSQVHFTHLESEITPSFTARSPNKTFLLTDIGREWAENRMTTSLLFSRGKWSSSFRMWSAKHCRKPKNGGEGSEKSKEGRKYRRNESDTKNLRAIFQIWISTSFWKNANSTVSLIWFGFRMDGNGFGGLGNLMGNF